MDSYYDFGKWGIILNYAATNYGPIRLPILENDFRKEYSLPYTIHNLKLTKNFNLEVGIFLLVLETSPILILLIIQF